MLTQFFTVKRQALDVVVARVSVACDEMARHALRNVRRQIDADDPPTDAVVEGVVTGAPRHTPTGLVVPLHWWCSLSSVGDCDFEGDLDFSSVVLDQTLIAARGHFHVRHATFRGPTVMAQTAALSLKAFVEEFAR